MESRKTFIPFPTSSNDAISYLLGILEDVRFVTLSRVKDLSIEELHWQYKKDWNSIGAILAHIISCENIFRIKYLENRELTTEEIDKYTPGLKMGKFLPLLITEQLIEDYIFQMRNSRAKFINQIEKINKIDFCMKREGKNPDTGFNLAWIFHHLAEDEVHHRGQISIIRKLYEFK